MSIARVADLERRVVAALSPRFGSVTVDKVDPLPGGASSLTFVAYVEGAQDAGRTIDRVVVKVAPPGLDPVRNRDVLRQARLYQMLADVEGVAVPDVFGTDPGTPPEVPPLFAMRFVEGESVEPLTEPDAANVPPPDVVTARAFAAARMQAALHAVATDRPELADERAFTPENEVNRWTRTFESLDDDLRPPTVEGCRELLLEQLPAPEPPVVMHGDWRLGNMLCQGTDIAAVIDWEIWSLGDPRVDLAWFMLLADPDRPQSVRRDVGMPDGDELAAAYFEAAGRELAQLKWFGALVRYKQAAAGAFITKNNRRLAEPDPHGEWHATNAGPLLDDALELLS